MAFNSTQEDNSWRITSMIKNVSSAVVNQSKKLGNTIKNGASAAGNKWQETSTVTKTCVIGGATAVIAPLAIIPALGAVGFTSAGVAAGSIAASMQTATTASGSLFALCQAAGATGVVATSTSVGVGAAAGATAGGLTAAICKKKSSNFGNNDGDSNEDGKEEVHEEDPSQLCDSTEEKVHYKLHLTLSPK